MLGSLVLVSSRNRILEDTVVQYQHSQSLCGESSEYKGLIYYKEMEQRFYKGLWNEVCNLDYTALYLSYLTVKLQ